MTTPHRAGVLLAVAVTLGALWALPATGAAQIPKPQRQGGRVTAGYPAGPRPPRAGRLRPLSAAGRSTALATIDRKSTRLNSSHDQISYAVFCLKKKKT